MILRATSASLLASLALAAWSLTDEETAAPSTVPERGDAVHIEPLGYRVHEGRVQLTAWRERQTGRAWTVDLTTGAIEPLVWLDLHAPGDLRIY